MHAAAVDSALPGCEESARAVASTGPITPAKFITAVSTAYATRKKSSGTTLFHSGLTERLIGGALIPMTKATIKRSDLSCVILSAIIKSA